MRYKKYLKELASELQLSDASVEEMFRQEFPGNYTIEWKFNGQYFDPVLKFTDPADDTWFHLQFSQFY